MLFCFYLLKKCNLNLWIWDERKGKSWHFLNLKFYDVLGVVNNSTQKDHIKKKNMNFKDKLTKLNFKVENHHSLKLKSVKLDFN